MRADAQTAQSPTAETALERLADCVATRGRLLVLFLIDESGSLKQSDPSDQRVKAMQTALDGLHRLTDVASAGRTIEVDVRFAGFGVTYAVRSPWRKLTGRTLKAAVRDAQSFAPRKTEFDTDYYAALDGARQSINEGLGRKQAARDPCKAVIWFTDGRYDIENRLDPQQVADHGATKYYAPDIRLDEPDGGPQLEERGKALLCQAGGLVDQLRGEAVTVLAVPLAALLEPVDRSFIDAVTSGKGCGSPGDAVGTTLPAGSLAELVLAFDRVIGETSGGTVVPPGVPVRICVIRMTCAVKDSTPIDVSPVVRRVHLIVVPDVPPNLVDQLKLRVVLPGQDRVVEIPGGTGSGDRSVGSVRLHYRWLADGTLIIDCELVGASSRGWAGKWSIVVLGTRVVGARAAQSQVTLFSDLAPRLSAPRHLVAGKLSKLELRIEDGKGRTFNLEKLGLDPTVTATLRDPTGESEKQVKLTGNGSRRSAQLTAPLDDAPSFVELTVRVEIGDGALAPIVRTFEIPVELPSAYPRVTPGRLNLVTKGGLASGTVRLRGGKQSACVWVDSLEPKAASRASSSSKLTTNPAANGEDNCVAVRGRRETRLVVEASRPNDPGVVEGLLTLALRGSARAALARYKVPFRTRTALTAAGYRTPDEALAAKLRQDGHAFAGLCAPDQSTVTPSDKWCAAFEGEGPRGQVYDVLPEGQLEPSAFFLVGQDPTSGRWLVVDSIANGADFNELPADWLPGPQLKESSRVRLDGIGPINIEMTLDEAATAARTTFDVNYIEPELNDCGDASPVDGPEGVGFMVAGDVIVRVDVFNALVRTDRGIGIGSTEEQIARVYAKYDIRTEPHAYTEGHYVIIADPEQPQLEIVFETDTAGRVDNYRAGRVPEVEFIEGCL